MPSLPVIDLSPVMAGDAARTRAAAREIDQACVETGFFAITGHGVSQSIIQETRAAAVAFFSLPQEEKLRVERPPQRISRGYNGLYDRALSYSRGLETPPDFQESFAIGPITVPDDPYFRCERAAPFFAPNLWPERPQRLRTTLSGYFQQMEQLSGLLMPLFALALGKERQFFDDKIDRHTSSLRLIRYPGGIETAEPTQLRAGEHTDYGTLTILRGDNLPGGLQVRHRRGGWMDVDRPDDGFICNIGDMMARWTNDHWVSNLHRVGLPPAGSASEDRYSIVFFHNANYDAEIRCIHDDEANPKYPPAPFDEIYLEKLMRGAHKAVNADARLARD